LPFRQSKKKQTVETPGAPRERLGETLNRRRLLAQICERTRASPVQHIGKILVVYLESPDPPPRPALRRRP